MGKCDDMVLGLIGGFVDAAVVKAMDVGDGDET